MGMSVSEGEGKMGIPSNPSSANFEEIISVWMKISPRLGRHFSWGKRIYAFTDVTEISIKSHLIQVCNFGEEYNLDLVENMPFILVWPILEDIIQVWPKITLCGSFPAVREFMLSFHRGL